MQTQSARTLGEILQSQARTRGDATFIQFQGKAVSFADMDLLATRAAKGLASIGVAHGARVCIALPNGIEFLVSWFGLARLGAIEVPINLEFKNAQVRYVVEDAGAEVLITDRRFLAEHAEALAECPSLLTVVLTEAPPADRHSSRFSLRSFDEILAADHDLKDATAVKPSDPIAIIYTSGTTGLPKGVLLCHEHEITLGENIAKSIDLTPRDCFYNFFPMHHNTGQGIIACSTLVVGAQMLLVDRFSRTRFWEDVKTYRCTVFYGMGAILEILNKDPDGVAASKGHTLRIGWGIAMGAEQVRRFTELFGVRFVSGYGSTEVNMVAIKTSEESRPGLVGRVLDDFEVAILDEGDTVLPVGNVGQIAVRPRRPNVTFLEYWMKPQETVAAWRNLRIHTGDAGFMDADGNLYFVDRIKDVIRHRGNNVSSLEVENVLLEFPAVGEAAVVPAPSDLGGYEQDVRAVVVQAKGHQLDLEALIDHCSQKLPYYAVPRYLDVVEMLPKTSTGKVRKSELKDGGVSPTTWDRLSSGISLGSHKSNIAKRKYS